MSKMIENENGTINIYYTEQDFAADLPEAGASAERISSVVRCCQNSEDILKETIENALYSTGNFTIEQCTDLAEGLILFIRDSFKNKSAIAHNVNA